MHISYIIKGSMTIQYSSWHKLRIPSTCKLEILYNRNWNILIKQNTNLCYDRVLTELLKRKWYSSMKCVVLLLNNSVISVSFKGKSEEKWMDNNVFILYYRNREKQFRRITVRFSSDSIVGIATRLWAGRFGIRIPAEVRDFILCKTPIPSLGPIKSST